MSLIHISLFSGIGGIDLAAEWAGFKTVLFVELDPYCQKVLNKHWPDVPIIGDIRDVKGEEYKGTIDLITGGFPCQPFSQAGQRKGKGDDRYLWDEMHRVIQVYKPNWIVGENVGGILTLAEQGSVSDVENQENSEIPSEQAVIIDGICSSLEGIGYEVKSVVLPACACEAPHRRDRVFIVAHLQSMDGSWGIKEKDNWELQRCDELGGCFAQTWLQAATKFCGMDDGIPNRVDRLKCLGNAVVPQQIYPILKAIAEIENKKNNIAQELAEIRG